MSAKAIVKGFYDSDLANDDTIVSRFFHKDAEMHWNSSRGFALLNYDDIEAFFEGTRQSYNNLRFDFTHFLENGVFVTTRHTLYATTIENLDEVGLAHFTSIWEVKDGKLFRCYEISQLFDEKTLEASKIY